MWRISQRRFGLFGLVATCVAVLFGMGTAHAASLEVTPDNVVPGGSLVVSGEEWLGDVAVVFVKGNSVLQAGTAASGPNGGPISITVTAPSEAGSWQVCANGVNRLDGQSVSTCAPVTVSPPSPSPQTTSNSPTSAVQEPSTTAVPTSPTQAPNSTTASPNSSSSVPTNVISVEPSTSSSIALDRPAIPVVPDGVSAVDEESASTEGSGLSGLTIGLVAGIVAVTGLGIVGLVSSQARHRPRRGTLVGIGLTGAVLAGATAIAMPPPKLNVPKLSISRIQVSDSVPKNAMKTVTATCPAGSVVIGGGWSSDWSSTQVDDVQPLVEWMEKQPEFVLRPPDTTNSLETYRSVEPIVVGVNLDLLRDVRSDYWDYARTDGTVHFSDTVWPSSNFSYRSVRDYNNWLIEQEINIDEGRPVPPMPEMKDIAWSEEIRQAFVREYYTTFDRLGKIFARSRFVGALVSESVPIEQGWKVSITNPTWSLQSMLTVQVVALCVPLAASTDDPGVLGVSLRPQSGPWKVISPCSSDETLTSMGFRSVNMGGVASMVPGAGLRSAEFEATPEAAATVVAVCVRKDGLETTSTTASTTVSGGYDDGTTATCPSGYTVTGGGIDLDYRELGSSASSAATAVSTAIPVGSKNFSAVIRSPELSWPRSPSGSPLLQIGGYTKFSHTAYSQVDSTGMTVHALCAKRVFTPA